MRRAALLLALAAAGCSQSSGGREKLVVLGIDGFDPRLARRFADEGRLEHLGRMMKEGRFRVLATSTPPQSPVAWSDFITGHEADRHGIYDFVHRTPKERRPYLSTSRTEAPRMVRLGKLAVPLGAGKVELLRKERAFWDVLADAGVPSMIFKVPASYPPPPNELARTTAGMGTPDLLGTYGTFHVLTDDRALAKTDPSGGNMIALDFSSSDHAHAVLHGPPNPFVFPHPAMSIDVRVVRDLANEQVVVGIGDETHLLRNGEWTEWIPISFSPGALFPSIGGMVRLHLEAVRPHVVLYASPINVDPTDPALPIASDPSYPAAVAEGAGRFYTQGMPEDTKAIEAGVISYASFEAQSKLVYEERRRLLEWHLENFEEGLLFFYVSSVDQTSHIFWRAMEGGGGPEERRFGHVIPQVYERADALVGRVLEWKDDDTTVIVMSDHGFAPWTWKVNLNAWLAEQGYLTAYEGREFHSGSWEHVDWTKTKAYGLGINQIFLNLEGREGTGFVPVEERDRLKKEIAEKLKALRHPDTGEAVVTSVFEPEHDAHPDRTPDLIVGYARGFRTSNESAIGDVAGPVIEPNDAAWSGDHCMDPAHVPGVLLATSPIVVDDPALTDFAPTVLGFFGVDAPAHLDGRPLIEAAR